MHNIPSETIRSMLPTDGGGTAPLEDIVHHPSHRPNSNAYIDDYNRVMLQYTQRQVATFIDSDSGGNGPSSSASSRSNGSCSSESSGDSSDLPCGNMARQASGPSAARISRQTSDAFKPASAANPGF